MLLVVPLHCALWVPLFLHAGGPLLGRRRIPRAARRSARGKAPTPRAGDPLADVKASSAALLALATVAGSIALPSLFGRFGFVAFNVVFALQLVLYVAAVRIVLRPPPSRSQLAGVLDAPV